MNKIIFFLIPIIFLFQAAHADVLIENDQKYIDDNNLLHIVGEIVNYTDKPISQIEILATTFSNTNSKRTFSITLTISKPFSKWSWWYSGWYGYKHSST